MYNKQIFTFDAATVAFKEKADGVVVDSEGEVTFEWDAMERVRVDDVPWTDAFETREFYKISATVARPVKQTYLMGEDEVTLMKPREELKKAAWSLHNCPWTLGHPDSRMVKSVDDIHGFWRDPRYIDALDCLDADLYIPINDSDAMEYVEKYGDVSVGFYNVLSRVDSYDGVVGRADDMDGVDGYQTDMYFDHCASVPAGRCSPEQGCGIHQDNSKGFINLTNTTQDSDSFMGVDASRYVNPEDDNWYAVPPADNPDDEWKYPINNCNDAKDAWNLRNSSDISISVETLEGRIKDRAGELDCTLPETATDSLFGTDAFYKDLNKTMTEETPTGDATFVADMAVDAIAAKNEGVQALVDEAEELRAQVDSHEDEMKLKDEKLGELEAKVDEYESAEKQELVDHITERTESLGTADELMELELTDLQDKKDLVDELVADEKTANGGGEESTPTLTKQRATPWE